MNEFIVMKSYTKGTFIFQKTTYFFTEDNLFLYRRWPFSLQKMTFFFTEDNLFLYRRQPFSLQKTTFFFTEDNLFLYRRLPLSLQKMTLIVLIILGYYLTFVNEFIVMKFEAEFNKIWNNSNKVLIYISTSDLMQQSQ